MVHSESHPSVLIVQAISYQIHRKVKNCIIFLKEPAQLLQRNIWIKMVSSFLLLEVKLDITMGSTVEFCMREVLKLE